MPPLVDPPSEEPLGVDSQDRSRRRRKQIRSKLPTVVDDASHVVITPNSGARRLRRAENFNELLRVVGGDSESCELSVASNRSLFAELFAEPEQLKSWQEFVAMSDERQERLLLRGDSTATSRSRCLMPGGDERYAGIDSKLRQVLVRRR